MKYFSWYDSREKNNCILCRLEGQEKHGELEQGQPLAAQRKKPYVFSMDDDYPRNVRLTDHLVNNASSIVASPRLRDFLLERLGDVIEALPVHILDHKKRIASQDYSIINVLDRQDCLAVEESIPFYVELAAGPTITGVQRLTIDPKKVSPKSQLFRFTNLATPILAREDLVAEIKAQKFAGMMLNAVRTI